MHMNKIIRTSVGVTALSCFAALSISRPVTTDPSLPSELALNEVNGVTPVGADYAHERNTPNTCRGRFIAPTAALSASLAVLLST
jgi:hypothetical protein